MCAPPINMPASSGDTAARRRVLFLPEAVTLAHLARTFELARALDPSVYEVHLACAPQYLPLFGGLPFPAHDVVTMPTSHFLAALKRVGPIWDEQTLSAYVESELDLIRQLDPALIVGDLRISLAVSSRLTQKPLATLVNAYWSPYARVRFPVPDLTITKVLGPTLAEWIYRWTRPLAFALHAGPLNRVCRRYGLPALSCDLREVFTWGDHVLYPDLPELIPTLGLPANHHYLGPLLWSPEVALPAWWHDLPAGLPIVYVTLGSSGETALLPATLQALATIPVTVVVATAGRVALPQLPKNVFAADYLPGGLVAARSQLVICNGGSPTTYQALSQGVPVLGLASNTDQLLNMEAVQRVGAGLTVRSMQASAARIRAAAAELLAQDAYRTSARTLAAAMARMDALGNFRRWMDSLLSLRGHS